MLILRGQSHSKDLFSGIEGLPLPVYLLDEGWNERALFDEFIRTSELFEVLIYLIQAVVAPSEDDSKECKEPREAFEPAITT